MSTVELVKRIHILEKENIKIRNDLFLLKRKMKYLEEKLTAMDKSPGYPTLSDLENL